MIVLEVLAWVAAATLAVPLLVLSAECLLALIPRRPELSSVARPRTAVLVPAHNEGVNLLPTLAAATAQLTSGDRLLVVADNCTDDTAAVARANGVEVAERHAPDRRGKGYALAFGRDALAADPPAVVVVLDADCSLGPDALPRLAVAAAGLGRPVQGAYTMASPPGVSPAGQVAEFAFLVKNFVRPLGLFQLGLPCMLTGTGMAFPWSVFRDAPLATGHIVEDMGLAVHLTAAGCPVQFLPDAEVWGEFPTSASAAGTQRRRWEHGHLGTIRNGVPRLVLSAVRTCRVAPLALALDLAVPPLSALFICVATALALLTTVALAVGPAGPLAVLAAASGLAATAVTAAWVRFGRAVLPARAAVRIPGYAIGKLGLYLNFFRRPERRWVRTDRS